MKHCYRTPLFDRFIIFLFYLVMVFAAWLLCTYMGPAIGSTIVVGLFYFVISDLAQ